MRILAPMRGFPLLLIGLISVVNAQVSLADLPALAKARAERQRPAQQKALEPFLHDLTLDYRLNLEIVDHAISGASSLGDGIAPLLLENMTPKEDSQEARNLAQNSARILKLIDPSGFTDSLLEVAAGKSETGRLWALWLLGFSKNPSAGPALQALMQHLKGKELAQAIDSMGQLGQTSAAPLVAPLLLDKDKRLRESALTFLTAVKSATAIDSAISALANEVDDALLPRYLGYLQVAAQDHAGAASGLLPFLTDEARVKLDKEQQTELVRVLATLAPKNHAPSLKVLKAIVDRQEIGGLGVAAALAMRELGDKRGIDVLLVNLNKIVGERRRDSLAYAGRGDAFLALGRCEEAVRDFRDALKFAASPNLQTSLFFSIAQAEAKRERWPAVKQVLVEAHASYDSILREMLRRPELQKAMANESVRKYVESLKK